MNDSIKGSSSPSLNFNLGKVILNPLNIKSKK